MYTQINNSSFSNFYNFVLDLLGGFVYYLLDSSRMDSTIGRQSMHGQTGNFRVEQDQNKRG